MEFGVKALVAILALMCAGCVVNPVHGIDYAQMGFTVRSSLQEPTSLDCRLMMASACAYSHELEKSAESGTMLDPMSFCPLAGEGAPSMLEGMGSAGHLVSIVHKKRNHDRDAGFVARYDDFILIAFRGTLPPGITNDPVTVIDDWVNDADAKPIAPTGWPEFPPEISTISVSQIGLEEGFLSAFEDVWPTLEAKVKLWIAEYPSLKVYITGHSKGGPMAMLAAMRLRLDGLPVTQVITYAAARAGDANFSNAYKSLAIPTLRYENQSDLVPHLPPNEVEGIAFKNFQDVHLKKLINRWNYVSVGDLRYITENLNIVEPNSYADETSLDELRMKWFGEDVQRNGPVSALEKIVNAHSSAPNRRYALSVCGGPPNGK